MKNHKNNCLNSIRLLAAALVLISHSWPMAGITDEPRFLYDRRLSLSFVAVHIFFAISGYLVTQSALTAQSSVNFAKARILRIVPGLWVCLLVTVACAAFVSTLPVRDFFAAPLTRQYLVGNFLFDTQYALPGVFASNPNPNSVNGSLWTLPVEAALYLFVGVFLISGILARREVFAATCLVCVLLWLKKPEGMSIFPADWPSRVYAFHMLTFIVGSLLFLYREKLPLRFSVVCVLWGLTVLLSRNSIFNIAFSITLSYSVLWLGFYFKRDVLAPMQKHDISYGVYLYAFPVQQFLAMQPVFTGRPLLLLAASIPLVLLLGLLSWVWIEKPALKLKAIGLRKEKVPSDQAI